MLTVTRKCGQAVRVAGTMVRILDVRGKYVKLGFEGPDLVMREELIQEVLHAMAEGGLTELQDRLDWEENQQN